MQHRVDLMLAKNPVEQRPVADIAANHQRAFAANTFYRMQCRIAAVAKIIQYNNFITCFKQRKCGVRADIAGTTRYQNLHSAVRHWISDK